MRFVRYHYGRKGMKRLAHQIFAGWCAALFVATCGQIARAQEVLPRPEPPFKGHIGLTVKDSTKDFPKEVTAPKGAPNILLILTDDVGFGASSTFGGPIPTPTFDRLAKNGLRYTQFHTTALCSPTRAALLTGRNHHSANTGIIMEGGTGFPGYNTLMSKSVGSSPKSSGRMGITPPGTARTTTYPTGTAARPGLLIYGRLVWGSNIFMDLSAETPVNGPRRSLKTSSPSSRPMTRRIISSTMTWPTTPSLAFKCCTPSRLTNLG